MSCHVRWLEKVWYFADASDQFVVEVSQLVKPMTFAPMESICLLKTLFILRRGIAAKGGIPLSKGAVWGYDFLVEDGAPVVVVVVVVVVNVVLFFSVCVVVLSCVFLGTRGVPGGGAWSQ